MPQIKFENNASSKLAGSINAAATSFSVTAAEGAKFPSLSGGDWFMATLAKTVAGAPVYEIVKVTARATDAFTVVRGQEGTTATTFSAGDVVELRLTRDTMNEFAKNGDSPSFASMSANEARAKAFIDGTTTNATASGTVTLDCDVADVFDLTLGGATTLALSNLPTLSNETFTIVVKVAQGATAYSLTWFSGITWLTSGGAVPAAPTINKTIEYVLSTKDGTNWTGRKGASN